MFYFKSNLIPNENFIKLRELKRRKNYFARLIFKRSYDLEDDEIELRNQVFQDILTLENRWIPFAVLHEKAKSFKEIITFRCPFCRRKKDGDLRIMEEEDLYEILNRKFDTLSGKVLKYSEREDYILLMATAVNLLLYQWVEDPHIFPYDVFSDRTFIWGYSLTIAYQMVLKGYLYAKGKWFYNYLPISRKQVLTHVKELHESYQDKDASSLLPPSCSFQGVVKIIERINEDYIHPAFISFPENITKLKEGMDG
ncbi:MAG: hypothetical protein PF689_00375 [Deltaproteobacteria bacterium]|jgi:hypothetical protein|nr:hypothetical protein [Deltaproteobacteria bacterium]